MPDVARLVDEAERSRSPLRLARGKTVSKDDIDAALSVAGAWKDWMDPEAFKRERRELEVHDREPRSP